MALGGLKISVENRKSVIVAVRKLYRSVRNHPFLVGILLFLVLFYKSFPFVFSLLVSASPVLVCTAVLLGTLLSLGQSNVPEVEKEEKISDEISALRTGWSESSTIVESHEEFGGYNRENELGKEIVEKDVEKAPLLNDANRGDKLEQDDCVVRNLAYRDLGYQDFRSGKQLREEAEVGREKLEFERWDKADREREVEGVFGDDNVSETRDFRELVLQPENLETDKLVEGSFHADRGEGFDNSLMPWKQVGDHDHDDGVDEESSLDSDSDGAESSSPDASMADIIPMLDELHPLLDSENAQRGDLSHGRSSMPHGRSNKLGESSAHSDVEDDHMEGGVGDDEHDDDDDDNDEEEQTPRGKEDGAKSVITWTEDDQKNLMDLGTSELERNLRLESLIARRRTRRRMMNEQNLIDLDAIDLQFQVAPISTTRRNPFDLPHDSYGNMDLPPIPGSAPSVLQPRRNPFDLPYDSSEEKPDLMGDSFQQEFMLFNQKEPPFHRHENFKIGTPFFEFPRHESREATRGSRFRPYFMTENTALEETSHSSFQRLPSDLSESKLSSVAETESTCAVVDEEEMKLINHDDYSQEMDMLSYEDHASANVEQRTHSIEAVDEQEMKLIDQNEMELVADKDFSEHVEPRTHSSEEVDSILDQHKKRDFDLNPPEIVLGGVNPGSESQTSETESFLDIKSGVREGYTEADSWTSETGNLVVTPEICIVDTHLIEAIEDKQNPSSSSSLLEEHDNVKVVELDESLVNVEQRSPDFVAKPDVLAAHAMDTTNSSNTYDVGGGHPKNAVYDSSPSALRDRSFSSSYDMQMETSEIDLHRLSTEQSDVFACSLAEVHHEGMENSTPENKEMLSSRLWEITDDSGHDVMKHEFSGFDEDLDNLNISMMPEPVVRSSLSSSGPGLKEEVTVFEGEVSKSEEDQAISWNYDTGIQDGIRQDVGEEMYDMPSNYQRMSLEDVTLSAMENRGAPALAEDVSGVLSTISSQETKLGAEVKREEEADLQFNISSSYCYVDEPVSHKENYLVHPSYSIHEEQEPSVISTKLEEASDVDVMNETSNVSPAQDLEYNIFADLPHRTSEYYVVEELEEEKLVGSVDPVQGAYYSSRFHTSSPTVEATEIPSEVDESAVAEENAYEETSDIKEMEEGLLSELDAVGDFSVKDVGIDFNQAGLYFPGVNSDMPKQDILIPETNSGMPATEVISFGDAILEKHESIPEGNVTNINEFKLAKLDSLTGETRTGLQALEARSVEDIDAALEKASEPEVGKSVMTDSSVELTREEAEVGFSEPELLQMKTEPGFPLTEGSMPEDIMEKHDSIAGGFDANVNEFKLAELDSHTGDTSTGLQVLEGQSVEDIDAAFKIASEVEVKNSAITESSLPQLTRDDAEVGLLEPELLQMKAEPGFSVTEGLTLDTLREEDDDMLEGNDATLEKHDNMPEGPDAIAEFKLANLYSHTGDISTGLQVLEARSVEDIDAAFKKASEAEVENSDFAKSSPAELTREETELGFSEPELLQKQAESRSPMAEAFTVEDYVVIQKDKPNFERNKVSLPGESNGEKSEAHFANPSTENLFGNMEGGVAGLSVKQPAGYIGPPSKQLGEAVIEKSDVCGAWLGGDQTEIYGLIQKETNMKETIDFTDAEVKSGEDFGLAPEQDHEEVSLDQPTTFSSDQNSTANVEPNDPAERSPQLEDVEIQNLPNHQIVLQPELEGQLKTLPQTVDANIESSSIEIESTVDESVSQSSDKVGAQVPHIGAEPSPNLGKQD
ncbi:hypothetical protein Ancab_015926 [Ancistrocladus abbreviatus]